MNREPALLRRHEIAGSWSFREAAADAWHPAEVPGCVHTDLMRNGIIPDPFFGANEQKLQWVGEKDWIYRAQFDAPRALLNETHAELVFCGLDTYASVILNDRPVLDADNMFREWRTDCKPVLRGQGNILTVRFRNVFDETLPRHKQAAYPLQASGNNDQADIKLAMYSRKAQFHFGWDWGPRLVTCGIWRPARIEAWSGLRIRSVFVRQENVTAAGADILSEIELLSDASQRARVAVSMDSFRLVTEEHDLRAGLNRITVRGRLEKPKLWWTNGLGEPHLYHYVATVALPGRGTDTYAARIGVRSLEVVREKDPGGRSFYVRLNGVPVFMKGANYVPQDNFQNRVTPQRYEHIIRSAAEAHMNMLRVWGGGIFEDDIFYDACDRYGLLIWHDLQFACAMYPSDDRFRDNVRREIQDNVTRLRNHASLALYCGNNENEMCWHNAWKQSYPGPVQSRYERDMRALYEELIPRTLREADPTRYYHPTSPNAGFNGRPYGEGDIHYWGVWHGKEPFERYPHHIARFVSEYGFQSYPELASVNKFTGPGDRELHSAVMLSHQRCMADERRDKEYGNRLIQAYLDAWYRPPKDFESYLYVSQVMQADGVRLAMEAHRRAMPYCMGSLYWQIDDCWPVASWSSIDYYGRWKALHYAALRCFAPVLISPVVRAEDVQFHAISDRLEPVTAALETLVFDFDGQKVSGTTRPVTVAANASTLCLTLSRRQLTAGRDDDRLVLVSRLKSGRRRIAENVTYFRLPKDLPLSNPGLRTSLVPSKRGYWIQVSARSLARSVMLACGDDPGFFSDNHFDVLPGGRKVLEYRTSLPITKVKRQLRVRSLVDSYQ